MYLLEAPKNLFTFLISFLIPNFIDLYFLWRLMFANFQFYQSVPPICVMTFFGNRRLVAVVILKYLHSISIKKSGETMGLIAPIQILQCLAPTL